MIHPQDARIFVEYPVLVPGHKIAYWPVPKNACTSLKYAFYALRTGMEFIPLKVGCRYIYHIHRIFPSRPFKAIPLASDWVKLAIVRDPLERLVSSYCNRVLYHSDLARHQLQLQAKNLKRCPSFPEFVENLDMYRAISKSIRYHTNPQVEFLGHDPSYFDVLISVKELKDLPNRIGLPALRLPKKQDGGREYKAVATSSIDSELRAKILNDFREDYEVFGEFFQSSPVSTARGE
ncbi:sulfotransferase family 2 domain-containing protein [Acaryochloris sp. IP29b_bin.137]|uniref:sulfotransferase family 2 domain-containing protein n=1 Tax=Acaryochloris sp. IP29b_bin.137 TaxID=2969217 RepID=UPI002635DBF4|nr:sulfotransferase family 2 domain-containing protein [Acaryochloris sp. IP29b_bin.137]